MNAINANQVTTLVCTNSTNGEVLTTTVGDLITYLQDHAANNPDLIHDELYHYGGDMFKALTEQYRALYQQANADPVATPYLPEPYTRQQQQLEQQIIDKLPCLAHEPIEKLCALATVFERYDIYEESWSGELTDGRNIIIDIQLMRVL